MVFLNCSVAHTSFSLNLWTLHNSICLWLPDKQMLCLFKHVLCIFRMSKNFSRIWLENSIWLNWTIDIELWEVLVVFWGQGFEKRGQWHVYMCCVCLWLTHRLIVNITLIIFVHYKKLSFVPLTHLAFKWAMARLKSKKKKNNKKSGYLVSGRKYKRSTKSLTIIKISIITKLEGSSWHSLKDRRS